MPSRQLVLVAMLAAVGFPAAAQEAPSVAANLAALSGYVWRGVSVTNRPTLQPDVALTVPVAGVAFTAGGFASVEPGRYDGPRELSEGGGATAFDVSELDAWLEVSREFGPAALTAGAIWYFYPNPAGVTSDANTTELYLSAGLDLPLSPSVALYYDVRKVRGAYLEASFSHDVALGARPVTFELSGGASIGQAESDDDLANFANDGLAFAALAASATFSAGPVALTPTAQLFYERDEYARLTSPETASDFKLVAGLVVGWTRELRGRR